MSGQSKIEDQVRAIFDRLTATYGERELAAIMRCWHLAEREERRVRLQAVMELSVELHRISETSRFCTRHGELVIESIIQGDLDDATRGIEFLTFSGEDADLVQEYAPLWHTFRSIASVAVYSIRRLQAGIEQTTS